MLNVAHYKHPADPFIFEKRNLSPNSNSVHFGLSNSPTSSVASVYRTPLSSMDICEGYNCFLVHRWYQLERGVATDL